MPGREQISRSDWNGNVYLDTDVILALLKAGDWLASAVDRTRLESPVTSAATAIEVQYVMEDEWDREQLSMVHSAVVDEGIDLVPLDGDVLAAAGTLRVDYEALGIFDSIHLGTASVLEEPIISTDSLYPAITEVEHIDPRDLG